VVVHPVAAAAREERCGRRSAILTVIKASAKGFGRGAVKLRRRTELARPRALAMKRHRVDDAGVLSAIA
jgi:hypothetical protein